MHDPILVGKIVAAIFTLVAIYFTAKHEYRKSSLVWSATAATLWLTMHDPGLVGKSVVLIFTLTALYFNVRRECRKSSLAWNATAATLWLISFA